MPGQGHTITTPHPWHDIGNTEPKFTQRYLDQVGESEDPLVYWEAEWPAADRAHLAEKTNSYLYRKLAEPRPQWYDQDAPNRPRPWPPKYLQEMKRTTPDEINRLIAFQMGMGIVPLPSSKITGPQTLFSRVEITSLISVV